MAILDMVERVRAAWGKKNVLLRFFIDLKKGFDTVDHWVLLAKLEHYRVRKEAHGLLASYLRDREQFVVYGGVESERSKVECEVPQGSVLRPLLFRIYVNDMVRVSRDLGYVLFGDDTNLFAEGKDPAELYGRVNAGLDELDRLFRCNMLTQNLKKTEYVYFSGPRGLGELPGVLRIGGERVAWAEKVRFLGVWVDRGLSWVDHILGLTVKVWQLLGIMRRASGVLDGGLLLLQYNGMVLPYLKYCLMVWGTLRRAVTGPVERPC